jgi:O-acetyl-ADP-ribose deacetylase (regulator of RNase III)
MFKFLEKQSYLAILLVFGVLLVVISIFDIKDISKLQVAARAAVIWLPAGIGFGLIIASLFFYAQDRLTLGWFQSAPVHQKDDHLQAQCKHAKISVFFGKIEEVANTSPNSLVVLPANEYFDDECIHDTKSALGAYVRSVFPNQASDVQLLITQDLAKSESAMVEKEPGIRQASYGVGSGVFLKKLLHSNQPVLFLAVTTKRAGEGLRAEMSYIFEAVKKMQQVAADNRITSVCIPVMGTGHGGLPKAVGLFSLILAICDGVTKPFGHHVSEYNIVVFRSSQEQAPAVSINDSRRILKTAIGLLS